MFWKWTKRFWLGVIASFACLLIAGASYQFISTKLDEKKFPAFGRLIDVGGYKLHMYSTGTEGPSVVLDAGLGCISSDWELVQKEASKFAHVISYDRAGTGWSEKSTNPRTSSQIVNELHTLLKNAGIPEPYILVGHSFGGNNVQLYAQTYPNEVSGIVLVDSCHENLEKTSSFRPLIERIKIMMNPQLVYFLSTFGISRFLLQAYSEQVLAAYPKLSRERSIAICSTQKHICTVAAEYCAISKSLSELKTTGRSHIKSKPCVIISAGLVTDLTKLGYPLDKKKSLNEIFDEWNDLQRDLASKYNGAHHLIAKNSDHMIPWNQPDLIVFAIKELL